MLKNYLKIAWRNLLRHKTFSLINILGLSIGVAACLLIFYYVSYELSFDNYHEKKDRIVRVTAGFKTPDGDFNMAASPALLAEELKRSMPEVELVVRLRQNSPVVKWKEEFFREENFYEADPEIFSVFNYSVLQGAGKQSLLQPNSLIVTQRLAKKYFGSQEALGQTLVMDGINWKVTAVIADPPANSDLKIDAFCSPSFAKATNWTNDDFDVYTFVLFKSKPDLKSFSAKLQTISSKLIQPELDQQDAKEYHVNFFTQYLKDVHYTTGLLDDVPKGNKQVIYLFSVLAVFILVIAILNYINLSTARATERAKEVGVRKVNGATAWQLIRQFLFESLLIISISWFIAFVLSLLVLPFFNTILQTDISFSWQQHVWFLSIAFFLTLLFAGLYPAFVLSGFRPVEILKGKWRHSSQGVFLRKALTVAQFVLTVGLITGAIVMHNQMKYISKKDLGFSTRQVINLDIPSDSVNQLQVNAFVNALKSKFGELNVTAGNGMQGQGMSMGTTFAETEQGKKRELMSSYQFVDINFVPFYGIKIKEGRVLSDSLSTDKTEAFIVNEAYVKNMGWKTAIGKTLEGYGRKGRVVGVVKNYYYQSLREMVKPTIIAYNNQRPIAAIAIKADAASLSKIGDDWKKYFPSQPFDFEFLDEAYAAQYKSDRTTQTLFTLFTALAIFISMMGLYGLVSLLAAQKSKEISVRKVLGASLAHLLSLLSKGFIKLIIIASALAIPVSWYAMNKWLENYAYHISLSWWMFLAPLIIIVVVALVVVSQQILKAALVNPVKALRE